MTKTFTHKSSKTGVVYYLNGKLSANKKTTLYYFSKEEKKETALASLPEGYMVLEIGVAGMPCLKRAP